jgi:DnaJ family protein C protein 11
MSQSGKATELQVSPFNKEGFLYSVLNLPDTASAEEVRERYRALSVLFHPDKQREESTKDTASKRFLEIQKAYEVLSDPFLRTVYDTYGFEGTRMKWPPELRTKPRNEVFWNARCDWNFLITKTAGENPEWLEMGTRSG